MKRFKILFILLLLVSNGLPLYCDSVDYMLSGTPFPLKFSMADNYNPGFGPLQNHNIIAATSNFHTEDRYFLRMNYSFHFAEGHFLKLKYNDNFVNAKKLTFQFSTRFTKSVMLGLSMKNYLLEKNYMIFNAGVVMDRGSYIYSLSVFNLGGFSVDENFFNRGFTGLFPTIDDANLYFADESNSRMEEGVMTSFIFQRNERFYTSVSVNAYVSSLEQFRKVNWSNIRWGMYYRLPDGSYLGSGVNSKYNSLGVGYATEHIAVSYTFLWQPSKFTHHLFTACYIF